MGRDDCGEKARLGGVVATRESHASSSSTQELFPCLGIFTCGWLLPTEALND